MSFLRTRWQRKYDFILEFDDQCSYIKYDRYQTAWDQCFGIMKCPVLNYTSYNHIMSLSFYCLHLHHVRFKIVIPSYNLYHHQCSVIWVANQAHLQLRNFHRFILLLNPLYFMEYCHKMPPKLYYYYLICK